jgi:hypothetical protein
MEFTYDKYIILASKYHLRADYSAYLLHKEALNIMKQMASTAKDTFGFNGKVVKKPIKQHEAKKVLDNLEAGKYDKNFTKVFYLIV